MSDIPGFYRDPKTGKYYRDKPGGGSNPSVKKLKKEREEEEWKNIRTSKCPKFSNVCKYLRAREVGLIFGLQAEVEYLKMKTHKKRLINEMQFPPETKIASIDFLKATENYVFTVWDIDKDSSLRCVVGVMPFCRAMFSSNIEFKVSTNYVIDLCEGPDESVICLYNNSVSGTRCSVFFPHNSDDIIDYSVRFRDSVSESPMFCLASGSRSSCFASGGINFVKYYERFFSAKTYNVSGRVYTISFDESSNIMVSGAHNGQLCMHDIRQKRFVKEFRVSNYSINESHFLDPHQVVVSGLENVLLRVDLRMNKVVTEYHGHKTSMKKRPFSIANNMLCANGADQVVRIWPLSGGNPIDEMKPFLDPENESRGWMYGCCGKTYLYHFENQFRRTFEIN